MPNRHLEGTAAALLSSWTDSDTAMQIVGTSLGLFGPGLLDPNVVLEYETPLRNALFDVLLSLVEGGALDVRPTEDAGYAFRFRADFATAALNPDTSRAIDIDTPSPYLAELIQARRERDEALGRADFAEALAAERERMLRVGEAPSKPPVRRRKLPTAVTAEAPDEIDLITLEAGEAAEALESVGEEPEVPVTVAAAPAEATVVHAPEPVVVEDAPEAARPEPEPIVVEDAPEPEPEPEIAAVAPEPSGADPISGLPPAPEIASPIAREPHVAEGLPPAPVIAAPPVPDASAPDASAPESEPAEAEPVVKKTPAKKATPKKRAAKKPATKAVVADTVAAEAPAAEIEHPAPSEVVYLPPLAPPESSDEIDEAAQAVASDDSSARRAKWSGYTLDKPRTHLSSVDRIADEG